MYLIDVELIIIIFLNNLHENKAHYKKQFNTSFLLTDKNNSTMNINFFGETFKACGTEKHSSTKLHEIKPNQMKLSLQISTNKQTEQNTLTMRENNYEKASNKSTKTEN